MRGLRVLALKLLCHESLKIVTKCPLWDAATKLHLNSGIVKLGVLTCQRRCGEGQFVLGEGRFNVCAIRVWSQHKLHWIKGFSSQDIQLNTEFEQVYFFSLCMLVNQFPRVTLNVFFLTPDMLMCGSSFKLI